MPPTLKMEAGPNKKFVKYLTIRRHIPEDSLVVLTTDREMPPYYGQ
jgi:hypothetical protein